MMCAPAGYPTGSSESKHDPSDHDEMETRTSDCQLSLGAHECLRSRSISSIWRMTPSSGLAATPCPCNSGLSAPIAWKSTAITSRSRSSNSLRNLTPQSGKIPHSWSAFPTISGISTWDIKPPSCSSGDFPTPWWSSVAPTIQMTMRTRSSIFGTIRISTFTSTKMARCRFPNWSAFCSRLLIYEAQSLQGCRAATHSWTARPVLVKQRRAFGI